MRAFGGAESAVAAIAAGALEPDDPIGTTAELVAAWRRALDGAATRASQMLDTRGTRVVVFDDDDWPLSPDADSLPAVLLVEGDAFEALFRPRLAVVGTRNPTPHGEADARELAALLADAGAVVVSGLAYGIDGAAHDAALRAGGLTIGVAATGLDVPYPRGHATLWARVRGRGLVLGENPFGTRPSRSIFPIRNRIIAALASSVVIVEAAVRGGAMHTARAALDLGKDVFAIPGSRRNPMAEGCNRLLADGAQPLLDPLDIAVAIGRDAGPTGAPPRRKLAGVSAEARTLHTALGGEPAPLDTAVARTGLPLAVVAGAARELERAGRLARRSGKLWPL
jgi:DNA processing protein